MTPALLLETSLLDMMKTSQPIPLAVLISLVGASIFSWTVIFSKLSQFKKAGAENAKFMRAFRKAAGMEAVSLACEQFQSAPLVRVFDFGWEEVARQLKQRGRLKNKVSIERSLQIGLGETLSQLEKNMNWLATVASVTPFIGLFGTVWGIIEAFQALGTEGSVSLRAVGVPISHALVATAAGLFAAIPAAVFYNYFGNTLKEIGSKMEDFTLEFMNLIERTYEEA